MSIATHSSVCVCDNGDTSVRGRAWLWARLVEGSLAAAVDAAIADAAHTDSYVLLDLDSRIQPLVFLFFCFCFRLLSVCT